MKRLQSLLNRYEGLIVAVFIFFGALVLVTQQSLGLYLPLLFFALKMLVSVWRRESFVFTRTAAISVLITYMVAGFLVSVPGALPHAVWLVNAVVFVFTSLMIGAGALLHQYT